MKKKTVMILGVSREQLTVPIDPAFLKFFNERLKDGGLVSFHFHGYDSDPRELYEVPEVRDWCKALFLDAMPLALKTLYPDSVGAGRTLIEACCNKNTRLNGRPAVEISPKWVSACLIAGINPYD